MAATIMDVDSKEAQIRPNMRNFLVPLKFLYL